MSKYYEILEVDENASEIDIKKAYKRLAKKYHPDLNKEPDAKDKFIQIHEAYTKLLNPEPEEEYSLLNSIFGSPKEDSPLGICNKYGIDYFSWSFLVDYEDFNLNNQVASLGRFIEFDKEVDKEENYKEYRWACNKVKLLNKIFRKDIFGFACRYIEPSSNIVISVATQGIKDIITHLNRVLNKEVDIKEKIKKPILIEDGYIHEEQQYQKLNYNTINQFHPKFLNKLPNKTQIYINKAMKCLIIILEKELKKLEEYKKGAKEDEN